MQNLTKLKFVYGFNEYNRHSSKAKYDQTLDFTKLTSYRNAGITALALSLIRSLYALPPKHERSTNGLGVIPP